MTSPDGLAPPPPALRRVLGTPLLALYGIGVIVGAGIYVLVGAVIGEAGSLAPWSFVLAGILAGLTGLSYAELAVRFPEAAGAAAYVKEAFGSDRLSRLAGFAVVVVVVVSTASIARGSIGYVQVFASVPGSLIAGGVVALFTLVACLGVRESVGVGAAMTLIEIGGLLLVIAAGVPSLLSLPVHVDELMPWPAGWASIGIGAFLAFFAFLGFENLANMAEEARVPERSLPRAILLSLGICTLLYTVIALVVVLTLRPDMLAASQTPLLDVTAGAGWFSPEAFAGIAIVAVVNGVLLELIMLGRLLFGMARRGWLPAGLGATSPRHIPIRATLLGGGIVFAITVAVPFASLVAATSTITLLVFAGVNLALWRLQQSRPRSEGFRVPRLIPPLAAVLNLLLAAAPLLD